MTTPLYGVTPQGFKIKRLIDVKNQLEDLFIGEFGDVNLDAQSVAGQLIGIFSKVYADEWENSQDVYFSQYPNSASGISLDNVVQLNGLTRLPAQRTSVIGAATAVESTFIPAGTLARLSGSGQVFFSTLNVIVTRSNSIANVVTVNSTPQPQVYTVLISGTPYIYSLPNIDLSGPMVSGNSISVRINGINMPIVNFAGTSNATLDNLASVIVANSPAVATAVRVGNSIQLTPALGFSITVNSVGLSGGGAPTYTQSFRTPTSADVAKYLAAVLSNSPNVTATWTTGNTFRIQADQSESPYSLNVGTNLTVTEVSSPIPFLAQQYGPVPAPVGTLTDILTPVAGWSSLTNFQAGITGRFAETDAELRLRRQNSLRVLGAATVEAIRARLIQEVPGVTSVLVFENVTLTQTPITITFSNDFVATNNVQVNFDGTNIGTISFTTTSLQMMNDIANLIATRPEILSVTVGGVGNRNLLITMNEAEEVQIILNISGTNAPTYSFSGGRPPKSFEAVVQGGSDQAVALKIWQTKPAGIQTYGNVNDYAGVVIVDSQGNNQTIHFSRAVPVYIWVNVALTLNPQETFPSNGQELVADAILAYGNSLGIGVDVFIQRVQAAVFSVPGIASAVVQLARTLNPTDTPSFATADIDIGETEISVWDLNRINVSV
jgi:uncharacterized phage protein gp47/JayE